MLIDPPLQVKGAAHELISNRYEIAGTHVTGHVFPAQGGTPTDFRRAFTASIA